MVPFAFSAIWAVAAWVLVAIVHIAFAIAVLDDSRRLLETQQRRTFLAEGRVWALAVLLGGVFAVGIYWVIHYSNLRPSPPEKQP